MSTVEELLYGFRTTDGSAGEIFFLKSFLSAFNDDIFLPIIYI